MAFRLVLICIVLFSYECDAYSRSHPCLYPSLDLGSLPRKLLLQQNNRQDFIVSIFVFSREWSTVSVTRTSFEICKNIVLLLSIIWKQMQFFIDFIQGIFDIDNFSC